MPLPELRLRQKLIFPNRPEFGRSAPAAALPLDSSYKELPMFIKSLLVNGIRRQVLVNAEDSLANVLRDQLQLTSVKLGCEKGHCGACSVILDGKLTRTCVLKMKRVPDDASIITLEGIGTPDHLHPLQEAWIFHGAAQCGFCTPGFIIAGSKLAGD